MRIAVIGAGIGGMISIRHISKNLPNSEIVGFEINEDIGGTWNYTEKTENDEFGLPLMTSMYKNLRTNLPKQVMEFPDFPMPSNLKTFMKNTDFLGYLRNYAKHFDLKKYIKFRHIVTLVKVKNNVWEVQYKNLLTGEYFTEMFDYVFVCNGHYNKLFIPDYKGRDKFKGRQIHSHNYRVPEIFKDKKVLVVGSGPSGMDISIEVVTVAEKLYLSHHYPKFETPFPSNYIQKPDVCEVEENSVLFMDETREVVDDILYCTGYAYSCPFLDPSCGITIERTHMGPLYRHIVNIEHPSMFFIGVPQLCCAVLMMDMQVRYVMAALTGAFKLPSKDNMIKHMDNDYQAKEKKVYKLERIATHMLGGQEPLYYSEMAEESGITPVPPVICALRFSTMETRSNLYTYRDHDYRIIDNEHFVRSYKGTNATPDDSIVRDSGRCTLENYKILKAEKETKNNETRTELVQKYVDPTLSCTQN